MKKLINRFLTALTLLSRIPAVFAFEADFRCFGFFFPLMGFLTAIPLWAAAYLYPMLPAMVAAVIGLVLQYWLFNLFHFDGLLDSADGLLFQGEPEKRLEIMKDSRIGSYALFVGVMYLVGKLVLLSEMIEFSRGDAGVPVVSAYLLYSLPVVTGRLAAAFLPVVLKPARKGGLGVLLAPYSLLSVMTGTLLVLLVWAMPALAGGTLRVFLIPCALALAAAAVTVLFAYLLAQKRIGGYTGDILGAAVEAGEMLTLVGMVIVWT